MKRITTLASALLLTGLLAAPVLAQNQGGKAPQQPPAQAEKARIGKGQPDSEGRALHKAYFNKREAMRNYRDEMLKLRAKNVKSDQ